MQEVLAMTRDTNGVVDFGFNITPQTYSMRLAADEVATVAIPSGFTKCVFTASKPGDFIVSGTAIIDPGSAVAPTIKGQFPVNIPWRTDLYASGFISDVHVKCVTAGDIYICFYRE